MFFLDSVELLICTHKWLHFISLSRDSSLAHLLVMPPCCCRLEVGCLFCILAYKRGSFSKGGAHLRGGTDFRILCALISFNFPYESTDRVSCIHADLKPENILFEEGEVVCLQQTNHQKIWFNLIMDLKSLPF